MGSPPHQDAEPQLGSRQGRRPGLGHVVSKVGFDRTGKSAQDSSQSIPSVAYPCQRSSPMHNGVLLYP
jgi:hypothetical protein